MSQEKPKRTSIKVVAGTMIVKEYNVAIEGAQEPKKEDQPLKKVNDNNN